MTEEFYYSIGHEIISKHEKELIDSLPELYPDEGERQIAQVLLYEFRDKLEEVFEEFFDLRRNGRKKVDKTVPLLENEIPEICSKIDGMIQQNRECLALDTLFKPTIERINKIRLQVVEELNGDLNQKFRDTLAIHGITDRYSFFAKGTKWYRDKKNEFLPWKGGFQFFGAILGRTIKDISLEVLQEVADKLNFPDFSEESSQKFRDALAEHGMIDKYSLLAEGVVQSLYSKEIQFPPWGGTHKFFGAILGRVIKNISSQHLEEVAKKLKLPGISEENKQRFRDALSEYGIGDRYSFFAKGVTWFNSKRQFPPWGTSKKFFNAILGRDFPYIDRDILKDVANILFPETPEERNQTFRDALADHGVIDRHHLIYGKGSKWFNVSKEAQFPPWGRGKSFINSFLDRDGGSISPEDLEKVAHILFPETPEETRQKFLTALAVHGITDRHTFFEKGSKWFTSSEAKFPPWGAAKKFFGLILNKSMPGNITHNTLEEIPDALGW